MDQLLTECSRTFKILKSGVRVPTELSGSAYVTVPRRANSLQAAPAGAFDVVDGLLGDTDIDSDQDLELDKGIKSKALQ